MRPELINANESAVLIRRPFELRAAAKMESRRRKHFLLLGALFFAISVGLALRYWL